MNKYLTPAITSITVFLLCIAILMVEQRNTMDAFVLYTCLGYALLCLLFLLFQMVAFIQAHIHYDEEIEDIKYRVLEAEGIAFERTEET